jgi:hypothetical protein
MRSAEGREERPRTPRKARKGSFQGKMEKFLQLFFVPFVIFVVL